MRNNKAIKPVALTLGAAFAGALAGQAAADADASPFAMTDLASGYMVADAKGEEGRCGEGKCGDDRQKPKAAEGQCGEDGKDKDKAREGQCGEKPAGDTGGE